MKNIRKWLRSPAATIVGFVIAAGLLLFSTVGGVQAALNDPSDYWSGQVSMKEIGVSLLENDEIVASRDFETAGDYNNGEFVTTTGALLTKMLGEGEKLIPGKKYQEELSIQNTGDIDQYSRVTIRKYWKTKSSDEANAEKDTTVSPALIHVELANIGSDWILDSKASTPERVVLYYNKKLAAGAKSSNFTKSLMIDGLVVTKVRQYPDEKNPNKIITEYDYSGRTFVLEASVDAVQDHNAQDAIKSAWGIDATISGDTLSIN